jgi:hypothetical protein
MNETKEVTITHDVINFKVPAELKIRFAEECAKDERTVSQQLRVLMLEYIAINTDWIPTGKDYENVEKNVSNSKVTKHVKVNKQFTRSK